MQTTLARIATGCATTAILAGMSGVAAGQSAWKPQKNVEIVVGTAPGGGQDLAARAVQRLMQEKRLIDVSSVVVNKAGAGRSLGFMYLNQHPGDGHYVMLVTTSLVTSPLMGLTPITYNDLTPLAMLFDEYIVTTVAAGSSIRNAQDLLARLKADPASVSVGITTAGGGGHLGFALAARTAGVDVKKLKTVVFKSGGESITALLGGHIDVVTSTTAAPVPHVRAGKLRIVAIAAPKRMPGELATVPTWHEHGINAEFTNWRGMVGPRGMAASQIAYWERVLSAVVDTPEFRSDLEKNYWVGNFARSEDMRKMLRAEHEEQKALLTELGLAKAP
jgi:putative tricarboxylic transport membrane protein